MDPFSLAAVLALLLMGVLFVYSASFRSEDTPQGSFYEKQIVWVIIGLVFFFGMAFIDYHRWVENGWWLYVISIFFLVLVLLIGKRTYGATRWLSFAGIQVQPSEFAKVTFIITLARHLGISRLELPDWQKLGSAFLVLAVPFLLILKEPDLGTAMVLMPVTLIMVYTSGVSFRLFLYLGLIALLLSPLAWLGLNEYQKDRIMVFIDPGRDPLGTGWNSIQSIIAVGSGGLYGKGYMNGTQNILGFLPRTVAPTDFIYSVIAEEMGFLGSAVLVGLFAFLIWRCIRAAIYAPDESGALVAIGVAVMLFCHVFVNLGMTIGMAPVTGVPLPLVSYGGSFMVITMAALGLVQSVYIRRDL